MGLTRGRIGTEELTNSDHGANFWSSARDELRPGPTASNIAQPIRRSGTGGQRSSGCTKTLFGDTLRGAETPSAGGAMAPGPPLRSDAEWSIWSPSPQSWSLFRSALSGRSSMQLGVRVTSSNQPSVFPSRRLSPSLCSPAASAASSTLLAAGRRWYEQQARSRHTRSRRQTPAATRNGGERATPGRDRPQSHQLSVGRGHLGPTDGRVGGSEGAATPEGGDCGRQHQERRPASASEYPRLGVLGQPDADQKRRITVSMPPRADRR